MKIKINLQCRIVDILEADNDSNVVRVEFMRVALKCTRVHVC